MSENKQAITLTAEQLRGLVSLSGLKATGESPLGELLAGKAGPPLTPGDRQMLSEIGWLEGGDPPTLTAEARAVMEALCQPRCSASLLLGTRDELITTHSFSAHGFTDGDLVSYAADPERNAFRVLLGQSAGDLADALIAQVLLGPLDQAVPFQATLPPAEFVTLLCIHDWRFHSVLTATLERESNLDTRFSVPQLWELLVEGRTAFDTAWQVTLFTYLLPFLDYELDEKAIEETLTALRTQGLVTDSDDGWYAVPDQLTVFFDAMLPVISYAAIHIEIGDQTGTVSSTHLAMVRGRSAILLVQPVADERAGRVLTIDSVDGQELAQVLLELGGRRVGQLLVGSSDTPSPGRTCPSCGVEGGPGDMFCAHCGTPFVQTTTEETSPAAPAPLPASDVCATCGTIVQPGSRFCSACGASLARPLTEGPSAAVPGPPAASTVCPSCGASVKPGLQFCTQCGRPLSKPR